MNTQNKKKNNRKYLSRKRTKRKRHHSHNIHAVTSKSIVEFMSDKSFSKIELPDIGTFSYNYTITKQKFDIISISLFRMKHSYRTFKTYTDGILTTLKLVKTYLPKFVIRLYFDSALINDANCLHLVNVLHQQKQQFIMFDCPLYKSDRIYHRGIFGMFIRYIPYFNFEGNDTNHCLVFDADPICKKPEEHLRYFSQMMNKFETSDAAFFRVHWNCYKLPWIHLIKPRNFILGQLNASKIKFPLSLLTTFLTTDIHNISLRHPKIYKQIMEYKPRNDSLFWYGVDEVFLSITLKDYIDSHRIKCMTLYENKFFYPYLLEILEDLHSNYPSHFYFILSNINKQYKKKFTSVKHLVDYLAKHYDWSNKTDKSNIYEYLRNEILMLQHKTKIKLTTQNSFCLKDITKYYSDVNNLVVT